MELLRILVGRQNKLRFSLNDVNGDYIVLFCQSVFNFNHVTFVVNTLLRKVKKSETERA